VNTDPNMAAAHQVNAWLARTQWRGPDSILDAVRQWQAGGLPPCTGLGRTILLDEWEAAISMLPGTLRDGDVTTDNLRTWPLFGRLRAMPSFDRLITSGDAGPPDRDHC
jgi:hypothetical protein